MLRAATPRDDYHTEVHQVGTTRVLIEITRFGLLWHGHATRVSAHNTLERNAITTAWGADRSHVYEQVINGVQEHLARMQ